MSPGRGDIFTPIEEDALHPMRVLESKDFQMIIVSKTVSGERIPKTHLARLIGDAVPTQLAYVVALIGIAAHIKSN